MSTSGETVIVNLHGQYQRRFRSVNQEFSPLAADEEEEEAAGQPKHYTPPVLPRPPKVRKIGYYRCPLPPTSHL
jgi:hypothetical protein